MEHHNVTERNIQDLYVRGGLSAEEQSEFEEHLFDCRQCQEEVSNAQGLYQGLREVVIEDGRRGPRRQAWFRAHGGPSWLAIAAGILIVTAPAAGLWWYAKSQSRELNQTRTSLSGALAREQRSSAALQQQLSQLLAPQTGVMAFRLSGVRSDAGHSAARAFTVPLTPDVGQVVFSLDVEPDPQLTRYRVRLQRGAVIVWESQALQPSVMNTVGISLPARLLSPGGYVLSLEGITADLRSMAIHHFPFHVSQK